MFSTSVTGSAVNSILLLTGDDSTSLITPKRLLENFNAIDFDKLTDGGYLPEEPDAASSLTSDLYDNYLWLFQRTTAAGGSSEKASRQVTVFKLATVQENEIDSKIDLIFVQIFGEIAEGTTSSAQSNDPPVADDSIQVSATEDLSRQFALTATDEDPSSLTYALVGGEGPSHGVLIGLPGVGTPAIVTYLPEPQYNGPDSFQFSVSDGEFTDIATVSITVGAVNDPPFFDFIPDPPPVGVVASLQLVPVTGVVAGPPGAEDETEIVTVTVRLVSETTTGVLSSPLDFISGVIGYVPLQIGQAVIEVKADDGQDTFIRTFEVNVTPPQTVVVVPNANAFFEGDSSENLPYNILDSQVAKYHQVYSATQFAALSGPSFLKSVAFRPDAALGSSFGPTTLKIQVRVATTAVNPGDLSATFVNNFTSLIDIIPVSGSIPISSSAVGLFDGTNAFDIVINFEGPGFPYNPLTDGNLLIEFENKSGGTPDGGLTTAFDAVSSVTAATSHVSALGSPATGTLGGGGLVTQFTFEAPPLPPIGP